MAQSFHSTTESPSSSAAFMPNAGRDAQSTAAQATQGSQEPMTDTSGMSGNTGSVGGNTGSLGGATGVKVGEGAGEKSEKEKEADKLYEERIEEEYAKREGGA
ncbi:hypothetical protein MMC30_000865 [Trapelia coarctata]|nr:hypothetical protein [Trapelia coarctata]